MNKSKKHSHSWNNHKGGDHHKHGENLRHLPVAPRLPPPLLTLFFAIESYLYETVLHVVPFTTIIGKYFYKSQLLLLGKFEYGGGPIFKVVLEC